MKTRISDNVGRFVAAYSIAAGPVECGEEPLEPGLLDDIKFFARVAIAIETAVTEATRPKEET